MRFACIRDFCRVDDRLRRSSSAWGLNGPSGCALSVPVSSATSLTASSGSISWLISLKRTDCAGGVDVMVGEVWECGCGCGVSVLSERVSSSSPGHDEIRRCLSRSNSSSLLGWVRDARRPEMRPSSLAAENLGSKYARGAAG